MKKIISTKEIAKQLGVTQGTATSMVKKLENKGFLKYEKHVGCRLTESGRIYGLSILRRHRLLETFLYEILKLSFDEIHEEAENLEHAVSDKLVDRIDEFLKYPKRDPHGALIPGKNQSDYINTDKPLAELMCGVSAKVVRLNGNAEQFKYFKEAGIKLGSSIRIISKSIDTGLATIIADGKIFECSVSILKNIMAEI